MTLKYNQPPVEELDPPTAEAIGRAQLVRFVPPEHIQHPDYTGKQHLAILCRNPGDALKFRLTQKGPDASGSWMDLGTGGVGTIWVVTASGNRYGIGNGCVYNHNQGGAYQLNPAATDLQVRIGEAMTVPGAGTTSPVKSVLINDEVSVGYSWTGKDPTTARTVNEAVDPLLEFAAMGAAVSRGEDPSIYVGFLRTAASQAHHASFV